MRDIATLAGSTAAAIFLISQLPMLLKAYRTRDLASYSAANIGLANVGNALYAVYLLSVPLGPAWVVHGFNMTTSALMLVWYVRHRRPVVQRGRDDRSSRRLSERVRFDRVRV